MASLAGDSGMFPFGLYFEDIRMAGFAGLVTGVNNGQCRNLRDCVAPIMPILTKAVRNEKGSNAEEGQDPHSKQGCNAEKMIGVLHDRNKGNSEPTAPA